MSVASTVRLFFSNFVFGFIPRSLIPCGLILGQGEKRGFSCHLLHEDIWFAQHRLIEAVFPPSCFWIPWSKKKSSGFLCYMYSAYIVTWICTCVVTCSFSEWICLLFQSAAKIHFKIINDPISCLLSQYMGS